MFERASRIQIARCKPAGARLPAAEKQARLLELRRRATNSTCAAIDSSRDQEEPQESSDEVSDRDCEERVSVESVVHQLYLQVEAAKRQSEEKDAQIRDLEACVAELTAANNQLRRQLLESQRTPLTSPCGSRVSGEPMCSALDEQLSNQLVSE